MKRLCVIVLFSINVCLAQYSELSGFPYALDIPSLLAPNGPEHSSIVKTDLDNDGGTDLIITGRRDIYVMSPVDGLPVIRFHFAVQDSSRRHLPQVPRNPERG